MGKGRLATSSSAFALVSYSYSAKAMKAKSDSPEQSETAQIKKLPEMETELDFTLPFNRRYIGVVFVNCKDRPIDPRLGSWIVAIENPQQINVQDQDLVDFEYTSWLTGRITQKAIDPCAKPRLEVVFEEVTQIKRPSKKKVPIKAAKKAAKKKGQKR